jgi:hypothetical protein
LRCPVATQSKVASLRGGEIVWFDGRDQQSLIAENLLGDCPHDALQPSGRQAPVILTPPFNRLPETY